LVSNNAYKINASFVFLFLYIYHKALILKLFNVLKKDLQESAERFFLQVLNSLQEKFYNYSIA